MVGSCTSHANSFVIGPAVINTHTLEFWVRFPNERNQGKQAHPVLKYRVPHGSQPRHALLVAGTTLFSGSLYLMVVTNKKALGAVTPVGGLMLIAG